MVSQNLDVSHCLHCHQVLIGGDQIRHGVPMMPEKNNGNIDLLCRCLN